MLAENCKYKLVCFRKEKAKTVNLAVMSSSNFFPHYIIEYQGKSMLALLLAYAETDQGNAKLMLLLECGEPAMQCP
jgi:hypothetical protein